VADEPTTERPPKRRWFRARTIVWVLGAGFGLLVLMNLLFPDLDLGTCYPSLNDIKPFQYEFCSTPAKDKDSLKQIKSQIYQTDTVSQFLGIINPNPIP